MKNMFNEIAVDTLPQYHFEKRQSTISFGLFLSSTDPNIGFLLLPAPISSNFLLVYFGYLND